MKLGMVQQLHRSSLPLTASLREAMLALDQGGLGIVFVESDDGRLAGTLTDGDVRRALLAGAPLTAPVAEFVHRKFVSVQPETDRVAVLDLMRALGVQQIPILSDGRLCGLHLLREMISHSQRANWAVVLAGGRGQRLRPLTDFVPKPMLPVAGRPILERIVLQLVGAGVRRIFLAVNYLSNVIEEHFGDGERFGCRIEYLREEEPLGTAGALGLLPQAPTEPLLVMNGDLVTQANLGRVLDAHEQLRPAATVALHRYLHTIPFGCVEANAQGEVISLAEKPSLERLVNCGIYVFEPALVAMVPRSQHCHATDLLEQALQRGLKVRGLELIEDWIDVGHPRQLQQASHGR
jgi:dTDP-glucose pyrophosphorylase